MNNKIPPQAIDMERAVPGTSHTRYHAEIVAQKAHFRRLIRLDSQLLEDERINRQHQHERTFLEKPRTTRCWRGLSVRADTN